LPFDSLDIIKPGKIDMGKFLKDKPVNFAPEKTAQSDIRLESREYDSGQDKSVFHNQGKYMLTKNDSIETIYVFDNQTRLLYIESIK